MRYSGPIPGYCDETIEVIRECSNCLASLEVQVAVPCPFRRTKPSANSPFGLLRAAANAKRFVFLVEEDIMVRRDYFLWSRAVQEGSGPLFCSIKRNPKRSRTVPAETGGYYLSSGDFAVWNCLPGATCAESQCLYPHEQCT